jgi:hypothetical protein
MQTHEREKEFDTEYLTILYAIYMVSDRSDSELFENVTVFLAVYYSINEGPIYHTSPRTKHSYQNSQTQ